MIAIRMGKRKRTKKSTNSLKNITLEEAERIIYEEIKAGKNFRDITKNTFLVDGKVMGLNPAKIHKIKEKFEQNVRPVNRDSDKALAFKKMEEGLSDVQIIEQTELPYEFVKKSRSEFLECTNKVEVSKNVIFNLSTAARKLETCRTYNDLERVLTGSVDIVIEYDKLSKPCLGCAVPIILDEQMIEELGRYIQKHYRCSAECWKSAPSSLFQSS